jgi:hypothetical protein
MISAVFVLCVVCVLLSCWLGTTFCQCTLPMAIELALPPERNESYAIGTATAVNCSALPDGFVRVAVRGGVIADLYCYQEKEYLVLRRRSDNFASVEDDVVSYGAGSAPLALILNRLQILLCDSTRSNNIVG